MSNYAESIIQKLLTPDTDLIKQATKQLLEYFVSDKSFVGIFEVLKSSKNAQVTFIILFEYFFSCFFKFYFMMIFRIGFVPLICLEKRLKTGRKFLTVKEHRKIILNINLID